MQHFVQNISPIIFSIGPIAVRWYGLAYLIGLLVGIKILKKFYRPTDNGDSAPELDDFVFYATLGVILGGRLGEVLFYSPAYFFRHPVEILALWKGGMSSHGGIIGLMIAAYWYAKRYHIDFRSFADALVLAAPLGLFLGRVANFINSEFVGKVTTVSWAVIFPLHDLLPRHPAQLYQALAEGPILFLVLYFVWKKHLAPGLVGSTFVIAYGVTRFFTEFFREVDPSYLGLHAGLTNGQLYSLIMVIIGSILTVYFNRGVKRT